ncbi:MAG TPA: ABC transporter ATP-binding protein, partial [Chloroflexota bacterium]|nr:ABC transporter ATP-binding protein [Chloroflexota bacterium]
MALSPIAATEAPTRAVSTRGLTRRFGASRALDRLDLAIPWDQRTALLGHNGAGKSTLLRIIATLLRPTNGEVVVGGLRLPDQAGAVRRHLGFVGHQTFLYDDLTARENLVFYSRLYGVADPGQRADELLRRVGIPERADARVRTLSR